MEYDVILCDSRPFCSKKEINYYIEFFADVEHQPTIGLRNGTIYFDFTITASSEKHAIDIACSYLKETNCKVQIVEVNLIDNKMNPHADLPHNYKE